MDRFILFRRTVAVCSMALVWAGISFGQSTYGTFVGTVRDPSGAVVPDCVVTLTNTGTEAQRSVPTDKEGNYTFVNLEPGAYKIVMLAVGFQPMTLSDLQLTARQTVRADGTLTVVADANRERRSGGRIRDQHRGFEHRRD
jgi:uncharacterized surface anchored protein